MHGETEARCTAPDSFKSPTPATQAAPHKQSAPHLWFPMENLQFHVTTGMEYPQENKDYNHSLNKSITFLAVVARDGK